MTVILLKVNVNVIQKLCVVNCCWNVLYFFSKQADLQISSLRIPLTGHQGDSGSTDLDPGQTLNEVIHHEVKELGTHMYATVNNVFIVYTYMT